MQAREQGFSLIEALVSVLILSTGLLGLAQLQVRLWSAANDLHALSLAYLLGAASLEMPLATTAKDAEGSQVTHSEITEAGTRFSIVASHKAEQHRLDREVRVEWQDSSGPQSLDLAMTQGTESLAWDSRWLLAEH